MNIITELNRWYYVKMTSNRFEMIEFKKIARKRLYYFGFGEIAYSQNYDVKIKVFLTEWLLQASLCPAIVRIIKVTSSRLAPYLAFFDNIGNFCLFTEIALFICLQTKETHEKKSRKNCEIEVKIKLQSREICRFICN